jgi:glycosyltransferase involved in cell wall biosynthesis
MGVVSPFATDMARVALGLGLPTAITWHCLMDRSAPVFRVLGQARRWGARGAALSAVSSVAAQNVRSVVGRGTPVTVLPNGIDVDRWRRPSDHADPATGGRVRPVEVVAAMRFAARKRPLAVLKVAHRARQLAPADVALRLTVFGEGPERGRLERFVRRHDMEDWVGLPGRVSREELRRRYWASDLYLTPARLEAFGIAALEARTSGLPVLARRDTGVGDFVVDGESGLLAADDEGLARALTRLLTDRALLVRIAEHNRTVPPRQSWDAVAAAAEAEYVRAGAS